MMVNWQISKQNFQILRVFVPRHTLALLLLFMTGTIAAADPEAKPFAVAHILLQVSDKDASTYASVLDISNNLIKHYGGPDLVDIEVIAFGKGVEMYLSEAGVENPNSVRIRSLQENGVRFYVCKNTMETLAQMSGKQPIILPGILGVQTGVAFVVDEVKEGFTLIKP